MQDFIKMQCLYKGSVKDLYQDNNNNLIFKFSDRYSIYDWGEMPDLIENKGKSLAQMSETFFTLLKDIDIKSHFIYAQERSITVEKVNVLKPAKIKNKYDYTEYQRKPENTLVPLEIIFRNGLPKGSSFFKRINDKAYLNSLGVTALPKEGENFPTPIIEFSTKLEPIDRYLSYTEAKYISGMSEEEFKNLLLLSKKLANKLTSIISKMELRLWDGKFEFAFDKKNSVVRSFKLVDSIGLDELRITKDNIHISKELLRQFYQETSWLNNISSYKFKYGDEWKKWMINDNINPRKLDYQLKRLISQMYIAFSSDLKLIQMNKKPIHINDWYKSYKSYREEIKKINILIIGSGGREHALACKVLESKNVDQVFITHKNHAMLEEDNIEYLDVQVGKNQNIIDRIHQMNISLVIIGPEAPLVEGVADFLRANDIVVFGPGKLGAKLEESKIFSKNIMLKAGIPTADFRVFEESEKAIEFLDQADWKTGYVIKADGLAGGKGVIVTENKRDANHAITSLIDHNILGLKDNKILIEKRLIGNEVSIFALFDKDTFKIIGNACDYKRIRDNETGPNTGGMGTYSPCEWLTEEDNKFIKEHVFEKLSHQLKIEKINFNGVIFAGLMKTSEGIKVLEFNVRFGDPETQTLLPRIKNDFLDLIYKTATNNLKQIKKIELKEESIVNIVCAAYGYPGTEGIKVRKNDPILLDFTKVQNGKIYFAGASKGKDGFFTAGGRVLGVTGSGANKDIARMNAYNNLKSINFEGMQYRNDIAK